LSQFGFGFRHDMSFGTKEWPNEDGSVRLEPWVFVTCFLEHRDGHSEKLPLDGPIGDAAANTPVQNMMVTGSILKRYSLLAITGTSTGGEDDEGKFRRAAGDAGSDAADEAALSLVDEGHAEAEKGLKALTDWWRARSPREQKDLQGSYGAMRKKAAGADAQKGGAA
jgi:hypothetical protein